MTESGAMSVGVVAAGTALAATVEAWPAGRWFAAILAAVALLGFLARRHGRLERSRGAPLVLFAGLGVTAAGTIGVFTPAIESGSGSIPPFPAVAALAGVAAVLIGAADYRSIGAESMRAMAVATARASAFGAAGLVGIYAWGALFALALELVGVAGIDLQGGILLSTIAGGLGTATVALVVIRWTDRPTGYVDLRRPTRRELGLIVVATATILGLNLGLDAVLRWLGLEYSTHTLIRVAEADPTILLVLIPLAFLVIGPGEELLYRNVVQKSLYDTFSRPGAILVASAIFAVVHLPAVADPNAGSIATLLTVIVIFLLSTVLGVTYERTGNVVVCALAHGGFDAVAFALAYVQLTGG